MKILIYFVAVLATLGGVRKDATAQSTLTEGYVQSFRSLYSDAESTSHTVGYLKAGEYVRVEHVHSLVYRAYRPDEAEPAGFVIYPKLSKTPPDTLPDAQVALPGELQFVTSASIAPGLADRWLHNYVNVRLGPSLESRIFAQLPPGSKVKVATDETDEWQRIYRPNETVVDPSRAIGFVNRSLLRRAPPQ